MTNTIYLKIPGIKGDVTAKGYEDWIELFSIDMEVDREINIKTGCLKNRTVSLPNVSELLLGKIIDRSSPYIFSEVCSANKAKDEVEIHFCKGSEPQPWLTYKLYDVLFTCYHVAVFTIDSNTINGEIFSINFTGIETNYVSTSYRTQINVHSNTHVKLLETSLSDELVDAVAGFGDSISFGLTRWVREKLGVNNVVHDSSSVYRYAGFAGNIVPISFGVKAAKWTYIATKYGREIKIGSHFRLAPFGNRRGHPVGKWPHYHRRNPKKINRKGNYPPGQGIDRHRPWEKNDQDKNFFDRF